MVGAARDLFSLEAHTTASAWHAKTPPMAHSFTHTSHNETAQSCFDILVQSVACFYSSSSSIAPRSHMDQSPRIGLMASQAFLLTKASQNTASRWEIMLLAATLSGVGDPLCQSWSLAAVTTVTARVRLNDLMEQVSLKGVLINITDLQRETFRLIYSCAGSVLQIKHLLV